MNMAGQLNDVLIKNKTKTDLAGHHLVKKNSKRPPINRLSIRLVHYDLYEHKLQPVSKEWIVTLQFVIEDHLNCVYRVHRIPFDRKHILNRCL